MVEDVEMLKTKILKEVEKEMKRRKPPISQAQLGERLGLQRHYVNSILRGNEKGVSFQRVLDMAHAVDLTVEVKISRARK